MKSPIALLRSLFFDLKRSNPGVKGLDRDLEAIHARFDHEGFGFLTKTLPLLDEALLVGLSRRRFACPTGFKSIRGGAIPRFLSGMLCKVFDPYSGELLESYDMCVLTDIHQLLRFFKKTRLGSDDEEALHQKAIREFYQCDGVAARVEIPDRHGHLIGRVSKLILNNLNSKEVENATYRHGPGSVEEGYQGNQKWVALDEALREGFGHAHGIWGSWLYVDGVYPRRDARRPDDSRKRKRGSRACPRSRDPGMVISRQSGNSVGGPVAGLQPASCSDDGVDRVLTDSTRTSASELNQERGSYFDMPSSRSAKLTSVLKNSTARRTITIEPLLDQYIQQGLGSMLRDSINECRILRNCIALTNQSLNQELALKGSYDGSYATLDLKSASDLMSLRLVETVFGNHGPFLEHVIKCRAPTVYSQGITPVEIGKFAGMGNALTFPIQSVCFAVVAIASILDSDGTAVTYRRVLRAARRLRIYGDDIIVETKYAHQVVAWLTAVGLKVNDRKSFIEGNFKESCGLEAYDGVVMTPLYIKDRPDQTDVPPSVIAGFVSLSNSLWMKGYYATSTALKNHVETLLRRSLPLVMSKSGSLGWHSRLDAYTPHKWCKRTHRFLTRTLALASIKKSDQLDGDAALLKCLSLKSDTYPFTRDGQQKDQSKVLRNLFPEPMATEEDHLESSPIRFKHRIVRRWVAA